MFFHGKGSVREKNFRFVVGVKKTTTFGEEKEVLVGIA